MAGLLIIATWANSQPNAGLGVTSKDTLNSQKGEGWIFNYLETTGDLNAAMRVPS